MIRHILFIIRRAFGTSQANPGHHVSEISGGPRDRRDARAWSEWERSFPGYQACIRRLFVITPDQWGSDDELLDSASKLGLPQEFDCHPLVFEFIALKPKVVARGQGTAYVEVKYVERESLTYVSDSLIGTHTLASPVDPKLTSITVK